MEKVIIANCLSIIAQIFLLIASSAKDKKKVLLYQIIFMLIAGTASVILGGYSVIAVNGVCVIRNILVIKDKNTKTINIILIIVTIILNLLLNNNGILGYLIMAVAIIETFVYMDASSSVLKIKMVCIMSALVWCIFCYSIKNYVDGTCNLISACSYTIFVVKELIKQKK